MFAPTIPWEVSNSETNRGAFKRRTTTSRSRVEPRERLDPLCKRGKPCHSATSACRSSAEALVLTLTVRRALGTRSAPDSSCSWWQIERVRHLRYEAAYQLGIAPVTVAGKDQSLAADALARAVAPHDLSAAHTTIGLCEQPVGDDFGQDDDPALFSGMAQAVDKLPARAARQTVHAQG